MTPTEALDATRIYSVAGTAQRARRCAVDTPPALPGATPYHLVRGAGVSLAHRGVLFPDEMPESVQLRRAGGAAPTARRQDRHHTDMEPTQVRDFCQVDETARQPLGTAMRQMQFSARAYHRILKLARTIADLAGAERVQIARLAEAIQYRPRRQE